MDFNEMREKASLLLTENSLDNEGRTDGGLYTYIDQSVCIRSQKTLWRFTKWPDVETYIELLVGLKERGITDASRLVSDEYERVRAMRSAHETPNIESTLLELGRCAKCGHSLFPCQGKLAEMSEAGLLKHVRATYCAVCDKCSVCDYHMSPKKG